MRDSLLVGAPSLSLLQLPSLSAPVSLHLSRFYDALSRGRRGGMR